MTELVFKGKEFVWNHHLAVPFRPLVPHAEKGIGAPRLDGNLIIKGDNLHALKALLPTHAGKVDVIFIDPPYNTGNEGWAYNDNVNAPMIREWLDSNPIGIEDGLRHDKWCAMMWPRLRLLHELLAERGSIWITLDSNEMHRAKLMLDEIFGEDCALETLVWEKSDSPRMDAQTFSSSNDFMLVYSKSASIFEISKIGTAVGDVPEHYNLTDDNGLLYYLKPLRAMGGQGDTRKARPNLFYALQAPDGSTVLPKRQDGTDGAWRWSREKTQIESARIEWRMGSKGWAPYFRIYADPSGGRPPETIWYHTDVGSSRTAKAQVKNVFGDAAFETPKPLGLLERVLEVSSSPDSVILDSFAGSGTTAHAVLEANKRDGGNRRFILVEMEDYADRLTAERVRRVIKGYDFTGTQRTELLRERLSWRALEKAEDIRHTVQAIENLHGHEYDRIRKEISGAELVVTGEKSVMERTEGLGGEFTYCTLGEPVELDRILKGDELPSFTALGAVLFHMATSQVAEETAFRPAEFFIGQWGETMHWLIYKPELHWLQSAEAALTLGFAQSIARRYPESRHVVFAPARHASRRMLEQKGLKVEFAPLPFALYRVERG